MNFIFYWIQFFKGVVKIASKDFNLDMDKYIKDRRSRDDSGPSIKDNFSEKLDNIKESVSEWKVFSLFRRKEKDVPYLDDIEEDDEDYSDEESEIEEIDDLEEELEERRENVFKRFFKKLRMGRRKPVDDDDDYYEEAVEEEDDLDDVKEVIKITHKWLEELPPETVERFKRSEDFQKYKEILRKLGMIK